MMRVPLRLAANLAWFRISQKLRGNAGRSSVLPLLPLQQAMSCSFDSAENSAATIAGTELLAAVRNSPAPIVWIAGAVPLLHPEMGQLTRCIAGIGRHVFLETDGALLRRRIHEFRPVSRLFFTLRLDGLEATHDLRAGRTGAFQSALEGLRAAKLSGFLLCVDARVDAETNLEEMAGLIHLARSLGADGFVISPAVGSPNSALRKHEALQRKTEEARQLIGNSWWESFSRLLEPILSGDRRPVSDAEGTNLRLEHESGANEESVNVA